MTETTTKGPTMGRGSIPGVVRSAPEVFFEDLFAYAREGSYIALGTRRPKKDGDVAPHYDSVIPVGGEQRLLEEFLTHRLGLTKYYCPNPISQKALVKTPETYRQAILEHRPEFFRAYSDHIRELAATWVDLDVGREGTDYTAEQALGLTLIKVFEGELPAPSLVAYSGRGSYLLWCLKEEDSLHPPLRGEDTEHVWRLTMQGLIDKTADLLSDPQAKNLNRWLKAPDTIDTNTGRDVLYMTFGQNHPSRIPRYTLAELMGFLDIPSAALEPPVEVRHIHAPRPPKSDRRGNAHKASERRYQEMEVVAMARGGILKGIRNYTCLYYHATVRDARLKAGDGEESAQTQAERATREFNRRFCKPPLTEPQLAKCTKPLKKLKPGDSPRKRRPPSTDNVYRAMGITAEESERLQLRSLVPPEERAAEKKRKDAVRERNRRLREMTDRAILAGLPTREILKTVPELREKKNPYDYIRSRQSRMDKTTTHPNLFDGPPA